MPVPPPVTTATNPFTLKSSLALSEDRCASAIIRNLLQALLGVSVYVKRFRRKKSTTEDSRVGIGRQHFRSFGYLVAVCMDGRDRQGFAKGQESTRLYGCLAIKGWQPGIREAGYSFAVVCWAQNLFSPQWRHASTRFTTNEFSSCCAIVMLACARPDHGADRDITPKKSGDELWSNVLK